MLSLFASALQVDGLFRCYPVRKKSHMKNISSILLFIVELTESRITNKKNNDFFLLNSLTAPVLPTQWNSALPIFFLLFPIFFPSFFLKSEVELLDTVLPPSCCHWRQDELHIGCRTMAQRQSTPQSCWHLHHRLTASRGPIYRALMSRGVPWSDGMVGA